MQKYKLSAVNLAGAIFFILGLFFLISANPAKATCESTLDQTVCTNPPTNLTNVKGTINWATTGLAENGYQLQIANGTDFTDLAVDPGPQVSTAKSYNFADLSFGLHSYRVKTRYTLNSTYYWTDWAEGDDPINILCSGTAAQTVVCPGAVTISGLDATLAWSTSGAKGETAYQLQVSTDSSFNDPAKIFFDSGAVTSTAKSYKVLNLDPGTYFWRINVKNANNVWTGWAQDDGQFDMSCAGDSTQIVVCTGKVTTSGMDATVNWSTTGSHNTQTKYQVQIDNDADFSSPIVDTGVVTGTAKTKKFTGLSSGLYYWRVQVWNASYQTPWKVAGAPFSMGCAGDITKIETCPQGVTVSGLNATVNWQNGGPTQTVCGGCPAFTWTFNCSTTAFGRANGCLNSVPAYAQAKFQVQLASDEGFSNILYDTGQVSGAASSYTFSNLAQGEYYWRLQVMDAFGYWTGWTYSQNSFDISTCAGDNSQIVVCPTSIGVNSPFWSSDGSLTWTVKGTKATQTAYQIQIDDNADFSSPLIDTGKVVSSAKTYAFKNLYKGFYFWRIQVWNNNSPTPYQTPWAQPKINTNAAGAIFNFQVKTAINAHVTVCTGSADPTTGKTDWTTAGDGQVAYEVQVSGDNFATIKQDSGWVTSTAKLQSFPANSFILGDQWRIRVKAKSNKGVYYVSDWAVAKAGDYACIGSIPDNSTSCGVDTGLDKSYNYLAIGRGTCSGAHPQSFCLYECNNDNVLSGGQCVSCMTCTMGACGCDGTAPQHCTSCTGTDITTSISCVPPPNCPVSKNWKEVSPN